MDELLPSVYVTLLAPPQHMLCSSFHNVKVLYNYVGSEWI